MPRKLLVCHALMRGVVNLYHLQGFGGSFQGFIEEFQRRNGQKGSALQLVQMVTETFPSFRDEVYLNGRKGSLKYFISLSVFRSSMILSQSSYGNAPRS